MNSRAEATAIQGARIVTEEDARLAFEEFVQEETAAMLRLARMLLRDEEEARDLVQDSQIRAFVSLDSFRWECSLKTWVTRILINQGLKRLRRRKIRERVTSWLRPGKDRNYAPPAFGGSSIPDPEQSAAQRELIGHLQNAMAKLSPRQQTVLVLRFYSGWSVSEIAELMGIGTGTVKTHLVRAVRQVRSSHAGQGDRA